MCSQNVMHRKVFKYKFLYILNIYNFNNLQNFTTYMSQWHVHLSILFIILGESRIFNKFHKFGVILNRWDFIWASSCSHYV